MTSNSQFHWISSPSSPKNRPTVPMSVYRELAGELQVTKHQLDQLKQENQQLHQQNQSLRFQVRQLVQSAQKLEGIISYWDEHSQSYLMASDHFQAQKPPTMLNGDDNFAQSTPETWLSHQAENESQRVEPAPTSKEVNGWYILAVVVMIILTFSGIGFMVARPLINNSGE